jgi:hypothetical protein
LPCTRKRQWLDYGVVADYGVGTDFCSRIGMGRSLEIRHAIRSILTKGLASRGVT